MQPVIVCVDDDAEIARTVAKSLKRARWAPKLSAVAVERDHVVRRGRVTGEHELRYPELTTPVRAHDGAYVVRRPTSELVSGLGLDALLALRHRAQ